MYYIYLLLCSDNSLYTGITNNLEKRITLHSSGKGSKYVRSRLPFKLIYTEGKEDKNEALKREHEIKSWTRAQKIKNLKLTTSN